MPAIDCALGRLDPLQLAWAAGFFDGEGSTIVHEPRRGYLRLTVSVPQSGGPEPPEVLYRFKAAMLGLGEIGPQNSEGMWVWRSRSGEEGQAAIALLWPQLGTVRRAQARAALERFHAQYHPSGLKPRPSRRTRAFHKVHVDPRLARDPVPCGIELDLGWAAGFLDGEGHFGLPRSRARKGLPDWHRIRVSATQNGLPGRPPEVLHRMQRIFGGKIEMHGEPDDFRWLVEGRPKVEEVFQRVRPWLGIVKQLQACLAIEGFRSQTRVRGDATHCIRGHEYSGSYMSRTGPKRRCNACNRILQRMKRAAIVASQPEGTGPSQKVGATLRPLGATRGS